MPDFAVAALIRWVGLLALAVLFGGLTLDVIVLPAGVADLSAGRRRLDRWNTLAVGVLIVASAGTLLDRTRAMSGVPLAGAIDVLPVVLTRTHFGAIWIARFVALGLLLALSLARARWARLVALPPALAVALTSSLTGHAGDWGDVSLAAFVDWSHGVAAAAWTGGLISLALAVFVGRAAWPQDLFATVARRFSRVAGACLVVVVLTGAYNAWVQIPEISALWTTLYGRVLALKLVLVLALAALGAVNRYAILPRLGAEGASGRLATFVSREALLALVVFGCTAVLGESTPKSHAGHGPSAAEPEAGSVRVSMEELHASGGVPKGWTLAPPPGDPVRGREVFRRLECFACHAVRGERFPGASKPGPALTDVGRHHPTGYLLESILNPNAVIVEGRGYTGPDGRSAMPDHRDSLSVGELIDLVAYLKSLGG
jgi:putative copper resistance protein D